MGISFTCLALSSAAAYAEDHPHYLHALSDLRAARAHIDKLGNERVNKEEERAMRQTEDAIREIKKASIDDHKDLNDHPPVDAGKDRVGRLHRALELLDSAKNDCSKEEDNGKSVGLQGRILTHIDKAHRDVEKAIEAESKHK
jgi:hypothetical protein